MCAVETEQMTAAETSVLSQQETSVLSQCSPRLLQTDRDHEILDVDQFMLEKTAGVLPNSIFLSTLRAILEGDIHLNACLQGVVAVTNSPWIP